jgi:hypothetical protein
MEPFSASSAAGLHAGRRIRLDFLGVSLFRYENLGFELLDLFGFPWILSSESRLFNGLREISAEKFFAPLFPLGSASP